MRVATIVMCASCLLAGAAVADSVNVENIWVRATAPGQKIAGGFMDIKADADMKLVGGSSPVSRALELHAMKIEDGVMKMRSVKEILLPRGQTVKLAPGGLHLMFVGINKPIQAGEKVPVTLIVKGADDKEQKIDLQAEARMMGSMPRQ
jgi:periplasmic copper chaperone A